MEKIRKKKIDTKSFLDCMYEYRYATILAPICVVFEVIMEAMIPLFMAQIVEVGIQQNLLEYSLSLGFGSSKWIWFTVYDRIDFVLATGGIMVAFSLISLLFGVLSGRLVSISAAGFAKNLRGKMYSKIQAFSFYNLDRFNTSSLVTRMTTDVTNVQMSFMMCNRMLVRSPVMLICALILSMSINIELSLIFLAVIPILLVGIFVLIKLVFPRFYKMLREYDVLNEKTQENLIGIRVVKTFVREKHEKKNFNAVSDNVQKLQLKAERIMVMAMPFMQVMMYACVVIVLWFGGNNVIQHSMELGYLIAFISYIMQILISLMMVGILLVMIVTSRASVERINEIFVEEIDIKDEKLIADGTQTTTKNLVTEVADGSVVFENVDFSYNKNIENLHLEKVNLSIKAGETIGVIGGTGSSKSTLVQLIPRLYDVTSGKVEVGGVDVREYELDSLRNSIGMVLQKNVLFSGTIKENMRWGNENATDEEIVEACKVAQADDFIENFPLKYETELGQGGVNLSGGQKQRLCIARALLKKPKILIMDDSTSAVDTATDKKIRTNFKTGLENTTVFIIAQRVTSVADADRIIVMDDGKVSAVGTHDELLKSSKIYQEVYTIQKEGVAQ